jgi:hypothetical protein
MFDPFKFMGRSLTESGSRSTALKPLMWFIGITLTGTIGCFRFGAPIWVGAAVGVLACLGAIVYLGAYVYFALTDKDALRSETYSIQKMALERRLIGDDASWSNALVPSPGELASPRGGAVLPASQVPSVKFSVDADAIGGADDAELRK